MHVVYLLEAVRTHVERFETVALSELWLAMTRSRWRCADCTFRIPKPTVSARTENAIRYAKAVAARRLGMLRCMCDRNTG